VGEVVSVDPAKNEIIIKDETGKQVRILISSSTRITRSSRPITLADVRAGDKVASECEASPEGCSAESVSVFSPAP
jgi:hypothetical protein